ncbi:TetR/AcrR family transcriptional regulator [Prauserella alba]|nr:TetR/AcrR family transcriptional regulator [Prauserella alba]
MNAAEALIFERGFAGAPIDAIIGRAEITKGTFFHHFASKQDLARSLIDRWALADAQQLENKMTRAERLARDPLQQLLLFVGFFVEQAEELVEPEPGCLFGAYCYQAGLFDERTMQVVEDAMRLWRDRLRAKLDEVYAARPPRLETDLDSLADGITVLFEGSFIVSRMLNEPDLVAGQLRHYRNYLELLFDTE